MVFQHALLSSLPLLPTHMGNPCPAEIITAYQQLQDAFSASLAVLRLDECDPIRIGHRYQHAKTFMLPLLKALAGQDDFPLPLAYTQRLREAVVGVVERLEHLHQQSLKRYDILLWIQFHRCFTKQELQPVVKCGTSGCHFNQPTKQRSWTPTEDDQPRVSC